MHTLNASPLLRRALLADGLVGLGTGSLLVLAAGWFAELLALPRELLLGAGLALALVLAPLAAAAAIRIALT